MKLRFNQLLFAAVSTVAILPLGARGADHTDSPAVEDDPAIDIADFYAWHTEERLVLVLNYAGLAAAGDPGTYDANALYGFHIDTDEDNEADQDIWVRFGQNGAEDWGVQVTGLPGDETVVGAVEENLMSDGGAMVFAGPREDPFFFDLDGFLATLTTETLAFNPDNDTFAGSNVTSIVVEVDLADVAGDAEQLDIWTTTARRDEE